MQGNGRSGDPEMARTLNRALILDLIRKKSGIPRVEIARALHLSRVTVSSIINTLLEEELVDEIGKGNAGQTGGRKPILLKLNTSLRFAAAVDIGTTTTATAISDLSGKIIHKRQVPTSKKHSVSSITAQAVKEAEKAIAEAGIQMEACIGLGVSVAGTVDKARGFISFSPAFKWHDVHITGEMERQIDLPVITENCTRLMLLGEMWHGAAQSSRNVFLINIGYGVGSALIIDGKLFNHHSEFGHTVITKRAVPCNCGKIGCIEAVASSYAVEKTANQVLKESSGWITARQLGEMARAGNDRALSIFNDAGRYLGRASSIIASTFYPEKIILSGGFAGSGDLLLEPFIVEFRNQTIPDIHNHTEIEISSLGKDAGLHGALAMVLNEKIFHPEECYGTAGYRD
jgi:N-acetylglucosamine repressor